MCLILLGWRVDARLPLLVAANRDEFHARPTARAAWWPDSPVVAGRDLREGGTWLGMTRAGRFAALTNYRDPAHKRIDAPSRGALVTWLLESRAPLEDCLKHLHRVGPDHNGFNVIFSDGERLGVYESVPRSGRELAPGIYGLSNHLLDTPWPKVQQAKSALAAAFENPSDEAPMLALLRDDRQAPDVQLPRTGASLEWERLLSSAFIRSADYGTRCSTIIRIDGRRRAYFDEWSWDSAGAEDGRVSLRFDLG